MGDFEMKTATRLAALSILTIALFGGSGQPVQPQLIGGVSPVHALVADRVKIPAIKVNLRIVTARFVGDTWDFSEITSQAAYLEGRSRPGSGGNAVIGAHSELGGRAPGPFYHLDDLEVGDEIIVLHNGVEYRYRVQSKWSVSPTDLSPILQTDSEVLTLITCEGYRKATKDYALRLIVRAVPIQPPVLHYKPPPQE